jgi:hypothetical protein
MGCQSLVFLGDTLTFSVPTHDPETHIVSDADNLPLYRIYEDETPTPILTGQMTKLDDANTVGLYTEKIACTALNGFSVSKSYTIYVEATVDGYTGAITFGFTVARNLAAEIDAIKLVTDDIVVTDVSYLAASNAGHLVITAALTFSETISGLTIPADWVSAYWTLKARVRDTDPLSLLQIVVSNPPDAEDGIVYLNASATLPDGISIGSGTLTVYQATGLVDIFLEDDLTALLSSKTILGWDVKFIDANGDSVGWRGTADIVPTETQTV